MESKAAADPSAQILEQATHAIVVVDGDDNVVLFNSAAEQLWGRGRDAVIGGGISRLLPPLRGGQHPRTPGQSEIDLLVGHNVELPIERPNRTRVWAEISVSRIELSGQSMRLITARNITLTKVHKSLRYQVLKAMAETESLTEILNLLCREIQRIAPEISAAIVRVDK